MSSKALGVRDVSSLKSTVYNSPTRIGERALAKLLESVRQFGIIMPLVIKPDGTIIDGHRRFAVAKQLGLSTVPVVVYEEGDVDVVYRQLNESTRAVSGHEWLHIYLNGGQVSNGTARKIKRLVGWYGSDEVLFKLHGAGMGASISDSVGFVAGVLGIEINDLESHRKVLVWIISNRRQGLIKGLMQRGVKINRVALWKAIEDNTDPELRWP